MTTEDIDSLEAGAANYLEVFQTEMDLFYLFSISWSPYESKEQIAVLDARLKPTEIEFLKIIRRERDNPEIRTVIQKVIGGIDTYERKSVDKERLSTGEVVLFTPELKFQEDREKVLGKLRNKVARRFEKELTKLPNLGQTQAELQQAKGQSKDKDRPQTFEKLWGKDKVEALRDAMRKTGISYKTDGRGKEIVIAVLHAASVVYGEPKRLKDWRPMCLHFFSGRKWSEKALPKELITASAEYKAAYHAILGCLQK